MEQIFKKGDRVFDISNGWGVVSDVYEPTGDWPVEVIYEESESFDEYTFDGRAYLNCPKVLSFTEYTLEGFSQDRPEDLPNRGDIVWGKNFDDDTWHIGHFYLLDRNSKSLKYCIASNPTGGKTLWVQQIKTTNPYANEQ